MPIINQFNSFTWILLGITLHTFGGMYFYTSKFLTYILCGLGLVTIFIAALNTSPKKPFPRLIYAVFIAYLIWSVVIIVWPFYSYKSFSRDGYSLINRYTWLSLFTPLIVFIGFKHISFHRIFDFSVLHSIIGIFLIAINFQNIFMLNQDFDSDGYQRYINLISIPLQFLSSSIFLVLCYSFISNKYRFIATLTLIVSIITVVFTARRGLTFSYLIIIFFSIYLYVFDSRKGFKLSNFILIFLGILTFSSIFLVFKDTIFGLFISRLDEDTRSGVESYFFKSFSNKTFDWILGRGINGTYYCPIFDDFNRAEIETGYLHIILKGGLIYLSLFTFFLAHSAYLGFFKTNNDFSKALALYLVAHLIFLIPYGLPSFSLEYIIVWVCVFYCQSSKFRRLSNESIKKYI